MTGGQKIVIGVIAAALLAGLIILILWLTGVIFTDTDSSNETPDSSASVDGGATGSTNTAGSTNTTMVDTTAPPKNDLEPSRTNSTTDAPPVTTVPPPTGSTVPPPTGSTVPPPTGSTTPPAGSTTPPAGSTTPPADSTTPPAGSTTPPADSTTPPAGSTTPPAGSTTPPADSTTPPAGSTTPPASTAPPPAGSTTPPATDPSNPYNIEPVFSGSVYSQTTTYNSGGEGAPVFLDRHNITCGTDALNSFVMGRDSGKTKINYLYECSAISDGGKFVPEIVNMETPWYRRNAEGDRYIKYGDLRTLKNIPLDCGENKYLTGMQMVNGTDTSNINNWKYKYTCANPKKTLKCENKTTDWGDVGTMVRGYTLTSYLPFHKPKCSDSQVMNKLKLAVTPDNNKYRYEYNCCDFA